MKISENPESILLMERGARLGDIGVRAREKEVVLVNKQGSTQRKPRPRTLSLSEVKLEFSSLDPTVSQ